MPQPPEPAWFDLPAIGQLPISTHRAIRAFRRSTRLAVRREGQALQLPTRRPCGSARAAAGRPRARSCTSRAVQHGSDAVSGVQVAVEGDRTPDQSDDETRRRAGILSGSGPTVTFVYYRLHPESKSDLGGGPGRRSSTGLLPRLQVVVSGVPRHIGKESNRMNEVDEGSVSAVEDVYVEYRDDRREWEALLPALRAIGASELARRTGMSERTLRSRLNSGRLPRRADRRVDPL